MKSITKTAKKPNQFKIWLVSNSIHQKELSTKCGVGVTNLHHLINDSKYSTRTLNNVAQCLQKHYKKDITAAMIADMVKITQ